MRFPQIAALPLALDSMIRSMKRWLLVIAVALAVVCGAAVAAQGRTSGASGHLRGVVTACGGPLLPGGNAPGCSAVSAKVIVLAANRQLVASGRANVDGKYSFRLSPGRYLVKEAGSSDSGANAAHVRVRAHHTVQANLVEYAN
jgi:hypothetical protein